MLQLKKIGTLIRFGIYPSGGCLRCKMKKRIFVLIACALCLAVFACALAACADKVERVTLDKTAVTMEIGDSVTLNAAVVPDNAADRSVSWSVQPADGGVIDLVNGTITALKAGTATVTASAGGKSASCTVTVNPVRTEVNESEWNAAFDGEMNTVTLSAYYSDTDFVNIFQADKINQRFYKQSSDTSSGSSERYYEYFYVVKEGDKYYRYNSSDAVSWERILIDENIYNDTVEESLIATEEIAQVVSGKYSEFSYKDGAYVAENLETEIFGTVRLVVYFEKGGHKKIVLKPDESIAEEMVVDFGAVDIKAPSDYTQMPINVVGKYYRIVESPTGWVVDETTYFKFNPDYSFYWQIYVGRIENGINYSIDGNLVSMTIRSFIGDVTGYAVIDGNILWNFDSIDDTDDLSNSNTFFYASDEISEDDMKKIIAVKGDGIATDGG